MNESMQVTNIMFQVALSLGIVAVVGVAIHFVADITTAGKEKRLLEELRVQHTDGSETKVTARTIVNHTFYGRCEVLHRIGNQSAIAKCLQDDRIYKIKLIDTEEYHG